MLRFMFMPTPLALSRLAATNTSCIFILLLRECSVQE